MLVVILSLLCTLCFPLGGARGRCRGHSVPVTAAPSPFRESSTLCTVTLYLFQRTPSCQYLEQSIVYWVRKGYPNRLPFICHRPYKVIWPLLTARKAGKSGIFLISSPGGTWISWLQARSVTICKHMNTSANLAITRGSPPSILQRSQLWLTCRKWPMECSRTVGPQPEVLEGSLQAHSSKASSV